MNAPDSNPTEQTAALRASATPQAAFWATLLSNVNVGWKLALIVLIMILGTIGVAVAGAQGLGVMNYHVSNLYEFMLIPIMAIDRANTALVDAQNRLGDLVQMRMTPAEQAANINDMRAADRTAVDVMTRYDREWVTTGSLDFTAILRGLGRMDLQEDEAATLARYHAAYDEYVQTRDAYLRTLQAGAPDTQLGNQAIARLADTRNALEHLIVVNDGFAQLSDAAAKSAYSRTLLTMGLVFAASLLLTVVAGYMIGRSLTLRLGNLTRAASSLQEGRLEQSASVPGRDEIARLGQAFNSMANQLSGLIGTLEQRVVERTAEIGRASERLSQQTNQLQASAEVARVVTTLADPDELIARVVNLIQTRFGFYYVGLFLVDETNRYAVLQEGTGEPGRLMKERGHRLELGGQSMVGTACATQLARIALDVGAESVRFANPLLPNTRSEMALPLHIGDRVLGALDIQSTQGAAFDQNDVAALQGMADQITVALENARLFQQAQRSLQERDELNRLLAGQGWQDYLSQAQAVRAAEFSLAGGVRGAPNAVVPNAVVPNAVVPNAVVPNATTGPASGEGAGYSEGASVLRVPLELRGQSIGTLVMERGAGSPAWSSEETETIRAIAQQATLTLETARLFEDAQRTAARERLLNEITARIRAATTLEGVLNSAVREISQVTGASFAAIDLELPETG